MITKAILIKKIETCIMEWTKILGSMTPEKSSGDCQDLLDKGKIQKGKIEAYEGLIEEYGE